MVKYIKRLLLTLLGSFIVAPQSWAGSQGLAAQIMAQGLYCRAFDLLSGDAAIILGLILGFLGFLIWIFKQMAATGGIMILAGVCLTALPTFFESTFQNVTAMAASSGMGNKTFNTFLEGRQSLGSCDQYQANLEFVDELILTGNGTTGVDGSGTVTLPDGTILSIDQLIDNVLMREGGCVNHPADRGGATNYGITQGTLSSYLGRSVTAAEVCGMSINTARSIYRDQYMPAEGSVPSYLMEIAFDSNVNHGQGGTNRILSSALSSIGASDWSNVSAEQGYTAYVQARVNYYANIIRNDSSQMAFADGWTNRMREFGYNGPELRDLVN